MIATKEHPIIFTTWSIPKIQDGTKTQTRRLRGLERVNESPGLWCDPFYDPDIGKWGIWQKNTGDVLYIKCPYGEVGDTLWVREAWRIIGWWEGSPYWLEYKDGKREEEPGDSSDYDEDKYSDYARQCDDDCIEAGIEARGDGCFEFNEGQVIPTRWRPSLFMPRFASRINLEITGLSLERLCGISEGDAVAEGCRISVGEAAGGSMGLASARYMFLGIWDSINGKKYPWLRNNWVWPIAFKLK